jgi:predicted HTH domain antitoxin
MAIQEIQLDALVKAGVFRSHSEAVAEAVQMLFITRPQLKVQAAIQLYQDGDATLGRAAEIAGMTRWEFETLLADRGITRIIESDPVEALEAQSQRLRHAE